MRNNIVMRLVVVGILLLFFGASIALGISGECVKNIYSPQLKRHVMTSSFHNCWPMFHHEEQHTGFTIGMAAIAAPHELWNFSTMNEVYSSAALFDVDKDFVMEVIIGSNDNHVYCLNATDGSYKWSYTTAGDIVSSPAVGDIYPGEPGDIQYEIAVGSTDDNIYCLDGRPASSSGHLWWSYTTGGDVDSSPVIYDVDTDGENEVIVGSDDGNVYCLAGLDGSVKWIFPTDDDIYSSPAIGDVDGDGQVEVVIGSWDYHIYCINGATGTEKWSTSTQLEITMSSPALGDVNGDGLLEVITASHDERVLCLNGVNGNTLWAYSTDGEILSSPAIGDVDNDGEIEVVIGSHDNRIYCLNAATTNASGELEWSYQTEDNVYSSPALVDIDGDGDIEILVGSFDSKLYCLDGSPDNPPGGTLEWVFDTEGQIWASPALGDVDQDGLVEIVIGSLDNSVYCLDGHILGDPPNSPTITGDRLGQTAMSYMYEFTAVDPNGKDVAYYIEWGDGVTSFWTPFHASGSTYSEYHTYHAKGIYTLRAKARNIHAESEWTSITVIMPKENHVWNHQFLTWLWNYFPNAFPLLRYLLRV